MDVPVSVYIIAKNEESRIASAVRSVISWADEVIVVDSGSEDRTVEIARSQGARVLQRDWEGYGPQKRFAEEQCRNDWVLNIDADEEVTSKLADEIAATLATAAANQAAFHVRVTDMLPGEESPRWFSYSYNVLRLYNKSLAKMSLHQYQDRIDVHKGEVSSLNGRILHRSFISWEATVQKMNFYSSQVAEQRAERGSRHSTLRLWFEFPATFLKIWLLRRYIFRGTMGLGVSLSVAYLNVLRLLKTDEALRSSAKPQHSAADISQSAAA